MTAVGAGTGLVFVPALPASKSRARSVTVARAAELRANPGVWAAWPSRTAASGLRKSLAGCDRAGGAFEARMRGAVTYARWVPAPGAPVAPAAPVVARPARGPAWPAPLPPDGPVSPPAPVPERPPVAPERPGVPPADPVGPRPTRSGPGRETVTVYDDDGENGRPATPGELAAFRPLVPPTPPPPVSADAWRPKIKCSACKTYLVIAEGTTGEAVLRDHLRDPANRVCQVARGSSRLTKNGAK